MYMIKRNKNYIRRVTLFVLAFLFLFIAGNALAYQVRLVYLKSGNVQINNPEISQIFYDELRGQPRDYLVDSSEDFELYVNLLAPDPANRDGRYSMDIVSLNNKEQNLIFSTALIDEQNWQEFYEPFSRDYYLKGPEFFEQVPAGKYKIEIYSKASKLPEVIGGPDKDPGDNQGKYVLVVGKKEVYTIQSILNIYWQLPLLKLTFLKTSVLQFFLTPFGIAGVGSIGALLIFLAFIYYLVGFVKEAIKHSRAKTLLLTSAGMAPMNDEIIKLLQKPAYDITVAFITTATKPSENKDYAQRDLDIMAEMGFNVEKVDIEGKKEAELMKLLELKDIIFVEGGNTFYLLKAMRECNFEKVIRKLLKLGKVYIGVSAGSIVAGRTIKTAGWKNVDKNIVGLKNLKGLNLVPFDIFVHYQSEHAEIIKQEIKNPINRLKKLKIITDEQAILVQGKEVDIIGEGEAVII